MRKQVIYGPVLFAVVGTVCGVVAAMLLRYDPQYDRVDLEESVPLAIAGAVLGLVFGYAVMPSPQRLARSFAWVEAGAAILLLGAIGAVIGWLAVDTWERTRASGMVRGVVIGSLVGLVYGAVRLLWDWRRKASLTKRCSGPGAS